MAKRAKPKKPKRKSPVPFDNGTRKRTTGFQPGNTAGVETQFKAGHQGGPGRPPGARNRLSEAFIAAVADEFDRRGTACLRQLDARDFVQVVVSLVPRTAKIDGTIAALSHEAALDLLEREDALELIERAGVTGGHEDALELLP